MPEVASFLICKKWTTNRTQGINGLKMHVRGHFYTGLYCIQCNLGTVWMSICSLYPTAFPMALLESAPADSRHKAECPSVMPVDLRTGLGYSGGLICWSCYLPICLSAKHPLISHLSTGATVPAPSDERLGASSAGQHFITISFSIMSIRSYIYGLQLCISCINLCTVPRKIQTCYIVDKQVTVSKQDIHNYLILQLLQLDGNAFCSHNIIPQTFRPIWVRGWTQSYPLSSANIVVPTGCALHPMVQVMKTSSRKSNISGGPSSGAAQVPDCELLTHLVHG